MEIKFNRYAIVTKRKPFEFIDNDCYETKKVEEAMLNDTEEIANNVIKTLDNPDEFEVLHIFVTYEM